MNNNNKKTISNKAAGVTIAIILFVIVIAGSAWFYSLYEQQDKYFAEGCIPRTFSQYGLATSMICPGERGYETALLSQ